MEIALLVIAVCIFVALKVSGDADRDVHQGCGVAGMGLFFLVVVFVVVVYLGLEFEQTGHVPPIKPIDWLWVGQP